MLGRTPFMKPWRDLSAADREVVRHTMDAVGITHLARRCFSSLSGGERQKAVLAMALAQETEVLLLDEPTAHLDISHQVEMLELLSGMNAERHLTVVAAMHDLNLASAYFRRLVLLKGGVVVADGTPQEVLTSATIGAAYSVPVWVQPHPVSGVPQVVVVTRHNGHE